MDRSGNNTYKITTILLAFHKILSSTFKASGIMKALIIPLLVFTVFNCFSTQAQTLDTLIDVGGYQLHFVILKGKGIPILFEAGMQPGILTRLKLRY